MGEFREPLAPAGTIKPWRARLMFASLLANSLLLGVVTWFVCLAVGVFCAVLDQKLMGGGRDAPYPALWIMKFHFRDTVTITSIAAMVTATSLFLSLTMCDAHVPPARSTLCLSILLGILLLCACYFVIGAWGIALADVEVLRDMGPSPEYEARRQNSVLYHLPPPLIDPVIVGLAASIYSVSLLLVGISMRRKQISL
ncbi:MAG TPA: hypothetical protein VGO11_16100 [Chthoniobacteraceae bacterium]|jgi:hypothetical protein|nr:hypothetical protein [Chthoniobacteraceae bacterium]